MFVDCECDIRIDGQGRLVLGLVRLMCVFIGGLIVFGLVIGVIRLKVLDGGFNVLFIIAIELVICEFISIFIFLLPNTVFLAP